MFYYFCLMIEGSGSGRPENIWILRIRNTGTLCCLLMCTVPFCTQCVGYGGGEHDDVDMIREQDEHLLPHHPALRVVYIVHLREDQTQIISKTSKLWRDLTKFISILYQCTSGQTCLSRESNPRHQIGSLSVKIPNEKFSCLGTFKFGLKFDSKLHAFLILLLITNVHYLLSTFMSYLKDKKS